MIHLPELGEVVETKTISGHQEVVGRYRGGPTGIRHLYFVTGPQGQRWRVAPEEIRPARRWKKILFVLREKSTS